MTTETATPDTSWMTPWEAWAWGRIVEGETADMAIVPPELRASEDRDREPVLMPTKKDEKGIVRPVDPDSWPSWQYLTVRFLEAVLIDPRYSVGRRRRMITVLRARILTPLNLESEIIDCSVRILRSRFDERMDLTGTVINGTLNLSQTHFAQSFAADRIRISGSLNIRSDALIEGEARLLGAQIDGSVSCSGSVFQSPGGEESLSADGITVKGDVFLDDAVFLGQVRFLGSTIGGDLAISKSIILSSGGNPAFSADRIEIRGGVFLRSASTEGEVCFSGADISGNLSCEGATFSAKTGKNCLSVVGAVIAGDILFNEQTTCRGAVDFSSAQIGGSIACSGSTFTYIGTEDSPPADETTRRLALSMESSTIAGSVFLRDGCTITGNLSLTHTTIKRALLLQGASFDGRIDLSSTQIEGELRLDEKSLEQAPPKWSASTQLVLQNARIGALQGSLDAWRCGKGFVKRNLDGLTVDRLSGGVGGESLDKARWEDIRRWLETDIITKEKGRAFSPSPYLEVARALDRAGATDKSRKLRIALENRITRSKSWFSFSAPNKFGRTFVMGPMTAYGYEPMRATWWFAGLVLIFAALGLSWELLRAPEYAPPGWRDILAWLGFSFESALPLIDLDPVSDTFLEDRFGVSVDAFGEKAYDELPKGLRALFAAERVLGLIILSVLVAGLTGWAETRGK